MPELPVEAILTVYVGGNGIQDQGGVYDLKKCQVADSYATSGCSLSRYSEMK